MTGYLPLPSPGRWTSVANLTPSRIATMVVVSPALGCCWPTEALAPVRRSTIASPVFAQAARIESPRSVAEDPASLFLRQHALLERTHFDPPAKLLAELGRRM